jgi:ABC-2 type transport system permease protein
MEASASKPVSYNRFLPYWAVMQADITHTLRSWVYRFWVLVSVGTLVGYLLYRLGPVNEHGIIQTASTFVGDLLRWTVVGSVTLIVVLSAGAISSERGSLADSILSRGISRYQYFMGKWHGRLILVLVTHLVLSGVALACGWFVLHEKLSITGSVLAVLVVAAMLAVVVSLSVAVSAMVNNTLAGISILWMIMYGGGIALSHLPEGFPSVNHTLQMLPWILRGNFTQSTLWPIILWSAIFSLTAALGGMVCFARRDV